MEMDLAEQQSENFVDQTDVDMTEICADELSPRSPDAYDVFGEPQLHPRLGNQYQVEIPCSMAESELVQQGDHPLNSCMRNYDYPKASGLPIPVMWVRQVLNDITYQKQGYRNARNASDKTESTEFLGNTSNRCNKLNPCSFETEHGFSASSFKVENPDESKCKIALHDETKDDVTDFATSASQKHATEVACKVVLPFLQQEETQSYCPLPGSAVTSWSDAESKSFLLGLYIFGKNLAQIRKFIDVKNIGDVLSFYYGKFYRSDQYKRWSECRKMRSRRCIFGQRIFTGWRQQELLSRLLSYNTTGVQDRLVEATRSYNEGKGSLEEYVFTLKTMFGMDKLVEAVAIGNGKHDITGIVSDPVRTNYTISMRPEVPSGKSCSSLTCDDIIKFLTGDFRLSKARSNDLFWEAVWPRLLAKGWHSEQPLDLASVGSKNTLVFLVPGIKKFSRKRHVKGVHYFDSVSDVLHKVASDPRLLELEVGGKDNGCTKEDSGAELKATKVCADHQRRSYLRPKVPKFSAEHMKFTVVDTSMFHGDTPFKVRGIRCLPVDSISDYVPSEIPEKLDSDSSGEDTADTSEEIEEEIQPEPVTFINNEPATEEKSDLSINLTSLEQMIKTDGYDSDEQKISNNIADPLHDDVKLDKSHKLNYLSPAPKRQRLSAATERCTISVSRDHKLQKAEVENESDIAKTTEIKCAKAGPSHGLDSLNYDVSTDCVIAGALNAGKGVIYKKEQPLSFDLNLPHCPTDSDVAGQGCSTFKESYNIENGSTQLSSRSSLRHSTRSRPLTTKVLEAFECGFFTAGLRGKDTLPYPLNNLEARPSRRPGRSARSPIRPPTDNVQNVGVGEEYQSCMNHNSHENMFKECQFPTDSKEAHELLGVP